MVRVFNRSTGEIYEEIQYKEKSLHFLYNTFMGRILLRIAISTFFSKLISYSKERRSSIKDIKPFIKKYSICLSDFEECEYSSFNDFFVRKIKKEKRPIDGLGRIISPADSKLLFYKITDDLRLKIKNTVYDISSLIGDNELSKSFSGGSCLVFRLTVDDYHRYCFSEDGKISNRRSIKGVLHTVSSLSDKYKVFCENTREYCLINSKALGKVLQMEVGAMLVGKITNHELSIAIRGEEKGFFSYGGSTIIVLYEKDKIQLDSDIIKNSSEGIETRVKYGEGIGFIC